MSNRVKRRPCVRVTARDVIAYCNHHHQPVTVRDAGRWLAKNKREIEREIRSMIQSEIENIFEGILLGQYVNPALNGRYLEVEAAIVSAVERYEAAYAIRLAESSYFVDHMTHALEQLLQCSAGESKICMGYENVFAYPEKGNLAVLRVDRVHLFHENGETRAELVRGGSCAHTDFVVIPGESSTRSGG